MQKISQNKKPSQEVNYKLFPKTILLPKAISDLLEKKVRQNPPDFQFDLIRAKFFIWLIIDKNVINWNIESLNEYIPIPAKTLRNYSPTYYSQYLDYLDSIDIIERLNHKNFKDDSRCKMFRLSSEALTALWDNEAHFTAVNLEELKSKVRINFRKYRIESWLYTEYSYLTNWFNNKLTVDFASAESFVASSYFTADQICRYLYVLTNFRDSNFYATMNKDSDGRLHTNLANFPKSFRTFLRYDGEGLVSYDLKSSQPFFFIALLEYLIDMTRCHTQGPQSDRMIFKKIQKIYKRNKENSISYIIQELREVLNSSAFRAEFERLKTMYRSDIYSELGRLLITEDNVENYMAVNEDGSQIYNSIGDPMWLRHKLVEYTCKYTKKRRVRKDPVLFESKRDMMKVVVLNILYGGIKNKGVEYRLFENLFPLISQVLTIFKQDDKNRFPKLLQQIESECILDVVSRKLAEKYPEMPLWTIHDSVVTTESFAQKLDLEVEIKALIIDYCGVSPIIEKDYFCKNCNLQSA